MIASFSTLKITLEIEFWLKSAGRNYQFSIMSLKGRVNRKFFSLVFSNHTSQSNLGTVPTNHIKERNF